MEQPNLITLFICQLVAKFNHYVKLINQWLVNSKYNQKKLNLVWSFTNSQVFILFFLMESLAEHCASLHVTILTNYFSGPVKGKPSPSGSRQTVFAWLSLISKERAPQKRTGKFLYSSTFVSINFAKHWNCMNKDKTYLNIDRSENRISGKVVFKIFNAEV